MKIAIVIGHNSEKQGAYSKYLETTEFKFWKNVAEIIKKTVPGVNILERKEQGSYSKEMRAIVDAVNSKGYDLVLELHYNAFNGEARGAEVLYWHNSKKGLEYSEKFKAIMGKYGIPFRRFIPVKDSSTNGYYGIMYSKMPYILLEPFFGDNQKDTEIIKTPKIMADILIEYLSGITGEKLEENPVKKELLEIRDRVNLLINRL